MGSATPLPGGRFCRLCKGRPEKGRPEKGRPETVASFLGVCGNCIRERPEEALPGIRAARETSRSEFGLAGRPPRHAGGSRCRLCARECLIGEGERGFCGMRTVADGRLRRLAGDSSRGLLHWYRDPLPTNCVADWVCRGSARRGEHNLAVFYASCTLDCLFCQNWHFRRWRPGRGEETSAEDLAAATDESTCCVCFFGGDPASQMPHALSTGRRLARRGITVCWETAGTSHPALLDRALDLSLKTGGCLKFDLKAWSEPLHEALTGASNRRTLENFAHAVRQTGNRRGPPPVIASTLLVPGYVDVKEVSRIARFIADLDPSIPYALLAFAPQFRMQDLPTTSAALAADAEAAARNAGLENVRVGNRHLLRPG